MDDSGWAPDPKTGGYVRTRLGLKVVGGKSEYETTSEIVIPHERVVANGDAATFAQNVADRHAELQEAMRVAGRNERDARNEERGKS